MIATKELRSDFGVGISAVVLICRAFAGTATDSELEEFISTNEIDWQELYNIARIHQLRPVMYKVLHRLNIPAEIKERLQADCRSIALHNLEHTREMVNICGLLSDQQITAVPYKGSIYGLEYYKHLGMREFSDIDFIININQKDLEKIKSVFQQLNYEDKSAVPADFQEIQFKYTREYSFDLYENNQRKFHAEFHWYTASQVFDFPRPMPNSVLFNGLKETDILGKKIKTLSATAHLLAMVTHHGLNQRWGLMKYAMDMAVILKNGENLDWKEIERASKAHGFNRALHIGLYIADHLLGVKTYDYSTPPGSNEYLNDLLTSLNKQRKSTGNVLLLNLKIKDNVGDRLKMLFKYLRYSATPSILDYKFIELPRSLFFLYAIIKPIRMLSPSKESDRS